MRFKLYTSLCILAATLTLAAILAIGWLVYHESGPATALALMLLWGFLWHSFALGMFREWRKKRLLLRAKALAEKMVPPKTVNGVRAHFIDGERAH